MGASPILFCSHVVEWGGAETVLADLLAALDRSRFTPHLACPGSGPLPDRARELGVTVHPLRIGGRSAWQKVRSLPSAARSLRALASEIGASMLYANTMIAGYAAVLASHRELPCLWHLHIVTRSRVARWALRRATTVVAPSHAGALAVDATLAGSRRLQVVQNGVSERFFQARGTGLRESLALPESAPLVGIVGRLDPHKGHEVLLQALAKVPGPAHLVIIGGESFGEALARIRGHGERLRRLVAELDLGARVHFLGHRDLVPELVSQLDVVVVPSIALESAPRAIAEAQAAGRAVIASRIGGTPELIDPGTTGILVPPGDVAALGQALRQLLGDPAERSRLAAAARDRARRDYSMEQFARRIEAACAGTIAGGKQRGP